ncbi:MAG: NAD(P)H-dependent oxidoreductase [Mesorhizobium sp.]|nr:MAG: NAD(P)H-dependent oxidoreductase [Mesorhizobium sp.]
MAVIARILVFAGSIRTGAFSGRTADVAQKELAMQGAEVTRISLGDYPLPIMDEDLEKDKGIPENAVKLGHQISAHDGLLIATPEYNGSIPLRRDGSRSFRPLYGKPVALCSSSEGKFAGIRCINHLRAVLVRCQMEVITPECSVSGADEAFAEDGQFRDARLHQSMERLCRTLIETSRMLSVRIEV